jgi:hypothetical protein
VSDLPRGHLDIFRDALEFIEEHSPVWRLNRYDDDGGFECCNGIQEWTGQDGYVHNESECSWFRLRRELRAFIKVEEKSGTFFGRTS